MVFCDKNMQINQEQDTEFFYKKRRTRRLYVVEALVEYLIAILVTGAYLATLTAELGMSDALTGILTAFVSLGQGFQLIALFITSKSRQKRQTTILQSINQLCFALIFFVPFLSDHVEAKIIVFVILFLTGHALNNVAFPGKTNLYMSQVDDKIRGRFTAIKEIVSLVVGMFFSFTISYFIDNLKANNNTRGAFLLCGIVIVVLAIIHALTVIFAHEKIDTEENKITIKEVFSKISKNKEVRKVIFLPVLWYIAHYAATPFNGSYMVGELGFSLTVVSVLTALATMGRVVASRPLGKMADKYSFPSMLNVCYIIAAVGFFIQIFTTPKTNWLFPVGYILYYISMAGINSGEINLIYDFVSPEMRVSVLAIKNFLAGTAGFLTTLAVSPIVEYIQAHNNFLMNMTIYAQQVTNSIAFVLTLVTILYLNIGLNKKNNKEGER